MAWVISGLLHAAVAVALLFSTKPPVPHPTSAKKANEVTLVHPILMSDASPHKAASKDGASMRVPKPADASITESTAERGPAASAASTTCARDPWLVKMPFGASPEELHYVFGNLPSSTSLLPRFRELPLYVTTHLSPSGVPYTGVFKSGKLIWSGIGPRETVLYEYLESLTRAKLATGEISPSQAELQRLEDLKSVFGERLPPAWQAQAESRIALARRIESGALSAEQIKAHAAKPQKSFAMLKTSC